MADDKTTPDSQSAWEEANRYTHLTPEVSGGGVEVVTTEDLVDIIKASNRTDAIKLLDQALGIARSEGTIKGMQQAFDRADAIFARVAATK